MTRDGYDLAGAMGDFPSWCGRPERSILICSHPRSGTTMLGEQLHALGGLGLPLEYFHCGFRPDLQRRWRVNGLADYIEATHRWRTDPSGVFSVKLFWQDVEQLAHERDPDRHPSFGQTPPESLDDEGYRKIWRTIADLVPNPTFIHLRREDRVRQAVSAMAAEQGGLWRSIPGVGRQQAVGPLVYDYDRIARLIAFSDYCHTHWTRLFDALGVAPYALTYEALDRAPEREMTRLASWLGVAKARSASPRMRRQSDEATEAVVRRFLQENARRALGPAV